jgi:hypothetical protein
MYSGLKEAKERNYFWRNVWIEADKPRSGILFHLTKYTKNKFRKHVHSWKKHQIPELSSNISNTPSHLWHYVSKLTSFPTSSPDVISMDPPLPDTIFKSKLLTHFRNLNPHRNFITVSPSDIENLVQLLKSGKSVGLDGIM